MPTEYIPDADRVLRYAKWKDLRKDENDQILGFNPQTFQLRDQEDYLSASWVDYFKPAAGSLSQALESFSRRRTVKAKDRFALGIVSRIKDACGQHGLRIRVTREVEPGFDEHCGLRQYRNVAELLDLLAAEAWAQIVEPVVSAKN